MGAHGLLGADNNAAPSFDTDIEAAGSSRSSIAGSSTSSRSSIRRPSPVARSQYLEVQGGPADGRLSAASGKTNRKSGLSYMMLAHDQDSDDHSDTGPLSP